MTSKGYELKRLIDEKDNLYNIPFLVIYKITDINKSKKKFTKEIKECESFRFPLIARSNFQGEGEELDTTGKFHSVPNILNYKDLISAVDTIMINYKGCIKEQSIIIQNQVENIYEAGVISSYNISELTPYITKTYILKPEEIGEVTDGVSDKIKNQFILRSNKQKDQIASLLLDLEILYKKSLLIEYCVDENNKIHLLQLNKIKTRLPTKETKLLYSKIEEELLPAQDMPLSNMSDWNPVEILGQNPSLFSSSFYEELFLNKNWLWGRDKLGYNSSFSDKTLSSNILGRPYIKVRKSLSSLFPKEINSPDRNKIIEHIILKIKDDKQTADSIEFNYAFDFIFLGFEESLSQIKNIKIEKIKEATSRHTENILKNYHNDSNKLMHEQLELRNKINNDSNIQDFFKNTVTRSAEIYSYFARLSYISQKVLFKFKENNALSQAQYSFYIEQFNLTKYIESNTTNSPSSWVSIYDIEYSQYEIKENKQSRLKNNEQNICTPKSLHFEIKKLIEQYNLNTTAEDFSEFLSETFILREESKLIHKNIVSTFLKEIIKTCTLKNICTQNIKHLHLNDVIHMTNDNEVLSISQRNKSTQQIHNLALLPDTIFSSSDLTFFETSKNKPYFFTKENVVGDIHEIKEEDNICLDNKIILIINANPSYDWIFNYNIKGLVTCYGGINSHMSIRAIHTKTPSAIGIGKNYYDQLKKSKSLHLDCLNNRITGIQ